MEDVAVAVGVGLLVVHSVLTMFRQLLSLKRQSSAHHILSQQLPLLETGFNWTFTTTSQIFSLGYLFPPLYLCLFVRISSMVLRLLTSKKSMEKQQSQFIDGTKFNKKDAFRES